MSRRSTAHRRRPAELNAYDVRPITAGNLRQELSTICDLLKTTHPYVTVHAEHHGGVGVGGGDEEGLNLPPGVRLSDLPAASRYALAKIDVDSPAPCSQLGITLCDADGKLPLLRPSAAAPSVWQVWLHDDDSAFVSVSGGVSVGEFADALKRAGVVSAGVTWVAYGGLYHLGFLLRVLAGGARLPDTKEEFMESLRTHLGDRVFDGRYVAAEVGLEGPLAHVAALLGAPAAATAPEMEVEPWLAGQRSVMACQVFLRLRGLFFAWDSVDVHAGCIHGLHSPTLSSS